MRQKDLALPLGLFAKEAKGMDAERIDALLDTFAEALDLDANLIKRHFYGIRFNYEDQFLADIEKQKKKRGKLEELAEEAESEEFEPLEEFAEEEEAEEEEED